MFVEFCGVQYVHSIWSLQLMPVALLLVRYFLFGLQYCYGGLHFLFFSYYLFGM